MTIVTISKDLSGRIVVISPYDPLRVQKIKTIPGHRWHPDKKYWSFPNTDGTLEKILKIFEGEGIHLDHALQGTVPDLRMKRSGVPSPVIASGTKQSQHPFGAGSESGLSPALEDLRRELLSRKYSYKTVKGYLYYNRNFLNFTGKSPSDINDNDIKDYLLYLAEEKNSATSTLNQAINALKFYYGSMLKKKFIYEIKRPRKDKKLPVVLSKEDVAKILLSIDNIKHRAILMLVYSAGLRVG
ncbi:MAG: phage integrase N-terminal SAM-like domain-containing protein, partial [Nitrospinota bacterium]